MFILGLLYNMFSFDLKPAINYINTKFKNKSQLVEANLKSLEHGYQYSETIKIFLNFIYQNVNFCQENIEIYRVM